MKNVRKMFEKSGTMKMSGRAKQLNQLYRIYFSTPKQKVAFIFKMSNSGETKNESDKLLDFSYKSPSNIFLMRIVLVHWSHYPLMKSKYFLRHKIKEIEERQGGIIL